MSRIAAPAPGSLPKRYLLRGKGASMRLVSVVVATCLALTGCSMAGSSGAAPGTTTAPARTSAAPATASPSVAPAVTSPPPLVALGAKGITDLGVTVLLQSVADVGQEVEVVVSFSAGGTQFAQATVDRILAPGERAVAMASPATSRTPADSAVTGSIPADYTASIADVRVLREIPDLPEASDAPAPSSAAPQSTGPSAARGTPTPSGVLAASPAEAQDYVCSMTPESLPALRPGSADPYATSALQIALNAGAYDAGPVDGKYGPVTRAAVRQFQSDQSITVDGLVGPQTWGALQASVCTD
jgi:hypothetical protein